MPRYRILLWTAIALSILGYLFFGYKLERTQTFQLISVYSLIFTAYLYLVYNKNSISISTIIVLGLVFRLLFLFCTPTLSDDFYRFIWDGRLWFNGINPFAELPTYYIKNVELAPPGINLHLYNLLNSPSHYTVYPPIPQFINWLAAWLATDSIWLSAIIMRIPLIIAEIGTLILLPKVLVGFNLNSKNTIWYALNPLIIIELTGNLHHEALMLFFIVLFLANYQQGKIYGAAFALAMSVAAKLLPLMFIPYLLLKMKYKESLKFLLVFGVSLAIVFFPLLDASFFRGIENSLLLYYQKFEFNAGIYYVFRQLGYWVKGYNMIALIGKIFALTVTISIFYISIKSAIKKWKLPETLLWISTLFAFFSLILHPWYISLIILFGSMTNYRFGILWSFLIMGTYAGYSATGFKEVMWVVGIEFIAVLAMLIIEIINQTKLKATLKVAP